MRYLAFSYGMARNPDREQVFRFKQFEVRNAACAMKIGTDGVMLGAWMPVACGDRVLDVGTGCGLIALMAAQRGASCVAGVEIEPAAADEATANAVRSPWPDRVKIYHSDFFAFAATYPSDKVFDLIVSNPPFFSGGAHSPDAARLTARHGVALDFGRLIPVAAGLLAADGRMALVSPADRAADIELAVALARMHVSRVCEVSTKPGAVPLRMLWEIRHGCGGRCRRESLVVGSDAYRILTSPFYLDK